MKAVKTIKTYSESIKEKYLKDKELNKLKSDLYKVTRGNIRNVCLNLSDEVLSVSDEKIMRNYFKLNNERDLRNSIKEYNIEGFRPICNFLKGKNESIQSIDALELLALIIDFNPRPYRNYRSYKSNYLTNEESNHEEVIYENGLNNEKSTITVNPKNKRLFAWFSTASAANKLFLVIIATIISVSIAGGIFLKVNQPRWMIWQEDHYKEVSFDDEKYNMNQLKFYKEDRIKHFKKLNADCNTDFFNEDGSVKIWYGKNKDKQIEYFSALGLHPETGKTLKPITHYIIEKYICN
ncbi:hypothetical protein [Mesoflavibacter zeaxanthinifaciens]|uniref:hypothetical protein n=1 Tax=Mesoflavibacter zeaxanthinifaciens TaxID=393060 RepID=UPI003A8CA119